MDLLHVQVHSMQENRCIPGETRWRCNFALLTGSCESWTTDDYILSISKCRDNFFLPSVDFVFTEMRWLWHRSLHRCGISRKVDPFSMRQRKNCKFKSEEKCAMARVTQPPATKHEWLPSKRSWVKCKWLFNRHHRPLPSRDTCVEHCWLMNCLRQPR
jgi:hypothetical protein